VQQPGGEEIQNPCLTFKTHVCLQEEIAGKTAQLKALWGQYQARKAEGGDLQVGAGGAGPPAGRASSIRTPAS
jgi:hypothetical protein